jgi:ubiquinone/menaquinone biosynthesis C-methylase UbiE
MTVQAVGDMVRYYEEAGPDYEAWSRSFNMHFGYWEPGMNPFDREAMLERMNRIVSKAFDGGKSDLLDMGCGCGATARAMVALRPARTVTGVTVVPWQIERARELSARTPSVTFVEDDYTAMRFPARAFDGVYAIESLCHGPGRDKAACLREAHRVLRRGGRFVVADGFLKQSAPLPKFLDACHRRICDCWTMDSMGVLPEFVERLHQTGFEDIEVREISWRVAPSVAHVPFVTLRFLAREFLVKRGRLSRERWNNLLAPLLTGIVGLARAYFGYYLIRATKA